MADIAVRAFKTGLQVFLAALPANALLNTGLDVWQTAGLAGLSAAAAVIHNSLLVWAES